jgi:hypothetical protein
MLFSPRIRLKLFYGFSIVCAAASLYHLAALFYPLNDLPVWRNKLSYLLICYAHVLRCSGQSI